jgi:cobalt-zinc-cadmium resistance protein CzcA
VFERLVQFSLKNKAAVLVLTAIVAGWGWFAFRDLTVEAYADPTETQVQVITLYPGQPSEEVERQIGLPLERALNGIPQLSRLRNLSLFGLSYVTLTFNDGVDGLWARAQVLERLRDADLPEDHSPARALRHPHRGLPPRWGAGGDPMALRTLQDWVVRPAFWVNGVADVVSIGGCGGIHVRPDPRAWLPTAHRRAEQGIQNGSVNASGGCWNGRRAAGHPERGSSPPSRSARSPAGSGGRNAVFLKDVADITGAGPRGRGGQPQRGDGHGAGRAPDAPGREPSQVLERVGPR